MITTLWSFQTSLTMAACLYSLGTHAEVQEKLRREVQDVVGEEELVTPQHIQNMHYLRDVIKETMRYRRTHSGFHTHCVQVTGRDIVFFFC